LPQVFRLAISVCLLAVGWVIRPVKNRQPYNLYCVGADVKPCSINQSTRCKTLKFDNFVRKFIIMT